MIMAMKGQESNLDASLIQSITYSLHQLSYAGGGGGEAKYNYLWEELNSQYAE
jgi:hypothetical protein